MDQEALKSTNAFRGFWLLQSLEKLCIFNWLTGTCLCDNTLISLENQADWSSSKKRQANLNAAIFLHALSAGTRSISGPYPCSAATVSP
jgi:hypothetical protein